MLLCDFDLICSWECLFNECGVRWKTTVLFCVPVWWRTPLQTTSMSKRSHVTTTLQTHHVTVTCFMTFFSNVSTVSSTPPPPTTTHTSLWYGLVVEQYRPVMFSRTINLLCNVWMLSLYAHDAKSKDIQSPFHGLSPRIMPLIFVCSIVGGWTLRNWNLPHFPSLLRAGEEPTSAAIFVPNWVAGLTDQKQYVMRAPQEQQIITVTAVCCQLRTALC